MKLGRLWILAVLAPLACSLTSSLDDLGANVGKDAGADQSVGGGGSGGTGGGTGGSVSGGTGGTIGGGGGGGFPSGGQAGGGTGGAVFPDASDPCVSQPDCNSCCGTSHGAGQSLFVSAIKKCVCQDPSCSQQCETYCTGGQLSQGCSTCVASQSVQSCIATECTGECKVYTDCIAGC